MITALMNRYPELPAQFSISHTTRQPRPGEVDGQHYHFVSKHEFETLINQNAFIEYAQVFDHYYGTSKLAIEHTLAQGIDVFLDIDWQGARQVRALFPQVASIFILPPSRHELENRLHMRGQDAPEVIESRMQQACAEMSHHHEYDFLIINENFDEAVNQLFTILQSYRLRQEPQAIKYQTIITDLLEKKSKID